MSLTTRKNQAQAQASAGLDRARKAATQVTPLAKNASSTAAQGIQGAREWAAPRLQDGANSARDWAAPRVQQGVHHARGWAAPRIEQVGRTLQDSVAPKVSGVLTDAAHRIEPTKRRVWPRLLAALALAGVIGGAVAAVLRKRQAQAPDDLAMTDEDRDPADSAADQATEDERLMADAEANGRGGAHH